MKLASLLLLCGLAACGGNPPAKSADTESIKRPRTTEKVTTKSDATDKKDELALGSDVRTVCGIKEGIKEAKGAPILTDKPKFDFDSYDLTVEEKQVLDQVADCLVRGPLKGKSVTLVGHADPRGEGEYNMALGAYRASAVKSYLGDKGVEKQRMRETSRGALDASGADEEGWREDRRVDITLAKDQ